MPVASFVATGTACGRHSVAFPSALLSGEESGIRDGFAIKDKWRVYSLFILSIEIIFKICVNRP